MGFNDVIVLIPSYEPEETLITLVKELSNKGYPTLVVNDGSKESFNTVFDDAKQYANVIGYSKNKGKGGALKYGIKYIRDNCPDVHYIITADSDGQHSVKDIGRVYEELKETNELVFGVRHFDKNVPFKSRFGNSFSKVTRSLSTKEYIPDDQCGLRGFPRKYFKKLLTIKGNKYDYEMNVLMLFQLRHYPTRYLEIQTIYLNNNKSSHFSPLRDTFRIQCTIFFNSLVSLFSLLLTVACYVILDIFTKLPKIVDLILGEVVGFQFFFIFLTAIYPTFHMVFRLRKELFYFAIRFLIALGAFALLGYVCHFNFIASAVIAILFSEVFNVILSRVITKHLYHTHN